MSFKFYALLFAALFLTACENERSCVYDEGKNTLSCSEKTYKTVKLNDKVWLAENLAYYDPDSSFCYGNEHGNCDKYGRLYSYESAKSVCPIGWALPTKADFEAADLKALNILNAGYRYASNGKFAAEGESANFWTADVLDDARGVMFRVKGDSVSFENFSKSIAYSVRCIKK